MSRPQYAVILTEENVDEIVAEAAKQDWTVSHLRPRMERVARKGDRLIVFMVLDPDGSYGGFNDTPYRDHLHGKIKLSEAVTHGHFKLIEEI